MALGLLAGLSGATCLADVAGLPRPFSNENVLVRVLCGLAIGLVTFTVVQFPDRSSPT
jgi:hypothetical protein